MAANSPGTGLHASLRLIVVRVARARDYNDTFWAKEEKRWTAMHATFTHTERLITRVDALLMRQS